MLRTLIAGVLVLPLLGAAEGYQEPDGTALEKQRAQANSALDEADRLRRNEAFLEGLMQDRQAMGGIATQRGQGSRANLDAIIEQVRGDSFLSQALAAGQQVMDNMESGHLQEIAPFVLVSFSMPNSQIKSLIEEAHGIGASVVIRGLVENDFPATVAAMKKLAEEGRGGGMAIDPTLFARFGIDAVPAFVLPLEPLEACDNSGCPQVEAVVAKGSATLRYFLELAERTGSTDEVKSLASSWLAKYQE